MKRVLTIVAAVLTGLAALVGGAAAYIHVTGIPRYAVEKIALQVTATPDRVARGRKWAVLLCATCHMDPTTRRLTGKRMIDAPPEFGEIYSRNITKHPVHGIGSWTDGELAYLLRTGVRRDGQYLPPYMPKLPHLSDEDLASIIAFLRSDDPLVEAAAVDPPGTTNPSFLTKFLTRVAFKPLPYPRAPVAAPPQSDKVAYGRYLVAALDCYGCHSLDFRTQNILEPEKTPGFMGGGNPVRDLRGRITPSANITFDDETGIGTWSEADFTRALRGGFAPGNRVIRYPMVPMPAPTAEDTSALYAYLKSVPKIRNAVLRLDETVEADASEGKRLYYRYRCVSCHGDEGVGIADLRQSRQHYPSDAELEAWIRNAPALKPGTQMPTWQGVIGEDEYAPLIAYVRELGR